MVYLSKNLTKSFLLAVLKSAKNRGPQSNAILTHLHNVDSPTTTLWTGLCKQCIS